MPLKQCHSGLDHYNFLEGAKPPKPPKPHEIEIVGEEDVPAIELHP
jgi:hypothetical protein